jgi:formamidopyrimidine-DNA glycosylase
MPELPEVEVTARLLDAALNGTTVDSALAPGLNTLKTFAPPLAALEGRELTRVRRRGKQLIVEFDGGLALLLHLMSAGRLQLYEGRAGPRDRTSRLLVRLADGRELRLREFGTKQAAWAKLLEADALASDPALARLGPEAWPEPPGDLAERLAQPRPLYTALRDQHVIAGIGRSWVDEILWSARLSPFKRGAELDADEVETRFAQRSAARSSTTSGRSRCRSPTGCRCRCSCTAMPASRARAARRRSSRSASRTMR